MNQPDFHIQVLFTEYVFQLSLPIELIEAGEKQLTRIFAALSVN